MKKILSIVISSTLAAIALTPTTTIASPYYGANFSYPISPKEPPSLRGFQLMLNYDPDRFKWRQINMYFDGGYSNFSQTETPYYSSISIYSIAPVFRYSFQKQGLVLPYLEISIGAAYLNHTHFEDRKLGIHFSFQDRVGAGAFLGNKEQFSVGLHAVHYSNAHLSSHNSGITIPIALDVGYRFQ